VLERGIYPTVCVAYIAGGISADTALRAALPFGAGEIVAGAAGVGTRPDSAGAGGIFAVVPAGGTLR